MFTAQGLGVGRRWRGGEETMGGGGGGGEGGGREGGREGEGSSLRLM